MSVRDTISLEAAKKSAAQYAAVFHEDLMKRHRAAMNCWECESFLQLGINTFDWLLRADRELRMLAFQTNSDVPSEIKEAIESNCRAWLEPCEFAEQWVLELARSGHRPENLDEFRRCCEEMRAIVEFFDSPTADAQLPGGLADLRNQAVEEQRNGETAEFF